jgi:predicted Co/Zn/Cd cation transporter (cation efflux family)
VEYKNWFIDTIISASIGVAFITSYFLQNTNLESWVKYTDPVITLAIIAFIIKLPLTTINTGIKEMLLSAPDDEIVNKIDLIIKDVISGYDFKDYNFKATKTGREIYLLIHIQVISDKAGLCSIKTQDKVREEIKLQLNKHFDNVKLDVAFSENKISYDY